MLRQGRGTDAYDRGAALAPWSMAMEAHVLAACLGATPRVSLAADRQPLWPGTVRAVHGMLQQLSQREAQVVRMRYGIGTRMHSVAEVGERLGVMPRQVERIELRAFRKLRDTSVAQELHERPAPFGDQRPSGRQPTLPAEPSRLPDEPISNPWDEV